MLCSLSYSKKLVRTWIFTLPAVVAQNLILFFPNSLFISKGGKEDVLAFQYNLYPPEACLPIHILTAYNKVNVSWSASQPVYRNYNTNAFKRESTQNFCLICNHFMQLPPRNCHNTSTKLTVLIFFTPVVTEQFAYYLKASPVCVLLGLERMKTNTDYQELLR